MKFLMKENQLEKFIFAFLNMQFMPHTAINAPSDDENGIWWIKNNHVICDVDEKPTLFSNPTIWIDEEIYHGLKGTFSLSDDDTEKYLKYYFNENHNLKYFQIRSLDMSAHQEDYEYYLNIN